MKRCAGNLLAVRIADGLHRTGLIFCPEQEGQRHLMDQRFACLFAASADAIDDQFHFLRTAEHGNIHGLALLALPVPPLPHPGEAPAGQGFHLADHRGVIGEQAGFLAAPHDAAIDALGTDAAGHIKIRVVGRAPGIGVARPPGVVDAGIAGLIEAGLTQASLANVIPGRPGEIADDPGGLFDHGPVHADFFGIVFAAQDHPLGEHFMILLVFPLQVIVAHHVQAVGKALGVLLPEQVFFTADIGVLQSAGEPFHPLFHLLGHDEIIQTVPEGADAVGNGPAGIKTAHRIRQLHGPGIAVVQTAALSDLVAGGPKRHAGMAAVALHEGG